MELTVRSYPQGDLAAQVLGYVGEVDSDDLAKLKNAATKPATRSASRCRGRVRVGAARQAAARRRSRSIPPGSRSATGVGRSRVGRRQRVADDRPNVQTRGRDGARAGHRLGAPAPEPERRQARLRDLEGAGRRGRRARRRQRRGRRRSRAIPTYPLELVGRRHQHARTTPSLTSPASDNPLLEPGDAGSVRAGLDVQARDVARDDEVRHPWRRRLLRRHRVRCPSTARSSTTPERVVRRRSNLQQALTVSSDAYFYTVGNDFWNVWKTATRRAGSASRSEARELGFGAATGFELDEANGPRARPGVGEGVRRRQLQDEDGAKQQNGTWYPYDDIFPAVGQGDLVVTPLQLANAYAAFANGGTLWQPHIEERSSTRRAQVVTQRARRRRSGTSRSTRRRAPRCSRASRARSPANPQGTAYHGVPGLPARAGPGRGQDRYRAGDRARATRRCSSAMFGGTTANPSTSWRSSWSRPGSARRPRRRSCGRSSRR